MTIALIVELSCDHDGCNAAFAPNEQEMTSVRVTRVGSTIAGWTRTGGQDFCPEHPQANELVEQIRQLASQRLTDSQIGRRLGLARHTVQALRSANGISPGQGRVGRPSGSATRYTQPRQVVSA